MLKVYETIALFRFLDIEIVLVITKHYTNTSLIIYLTLYNYMHFSIISLVSHKYLIVIGVVVAGSCPWSNLCTEREVETAMCI